LPDGIVGSAYHAQLAQTGGTGPFTWTKASGDLPAGLVLDPDGTIHGTPTTAQTVYPSFTVTDADGVAVTTPPIALDISAASGGAVAYDDPATGVTASSATGHGRVQAGSGVVTSIYCRLATSAAGVDGIPIVFASPAFTGAGGAVVPVTCWFGGLQDQTAYYYKVYAVDAGGTHGSGYPQAFTTSATPANDQTVKVSAPRSIKFRGTSVLLKKTLRTNVGAKVVVKVKVEGKSPNGAKAFRVLTNAKTGKVQIQTYGKNVRLAVTYSAPAKSGRRAWSASFRYIVKKSAPNL
jgi:hypothetical protein